MIHTILHFNIACRLLPAATIMCAFTYICIQTQKHGDRLLCPAPQCQGNMACCIRAVSSGCPIMMFRFCMACPAAPLSKLSRTAAANGNQQSDAAWTFRSSPCCGAQQKENSLCCKAKACNTIKFHVSTQQASWLDALACIQPAHLDNKMLQAKHCRLPCSPKSTDQHF